MRPLDPMKIFLHQEFRVVASGLWREGSEAVVDGEGCAQALDAVDQLEVTDNAANGK